MILCSLVAFGFIISSKALLVEYWILIEMNIFYRTVKIISKCKCSFLCYNRGYTKGINLIREVSTGYLKEVGIKHDLVGNIGKVL